MVDFSLVYNTSVENNPIANWAKNFDSTYSTVAKQALESQKNWLKMFLPENYKIEQWAEHYFPVTYVLY